MIICSKIDKMEHSIARRERGKVFCRDFPLRLDFSNFFKNLSNISL